MLNRAHVRTMLLAAHGLTAPTPTPTTKEDVRRIIRQMHVLQIDTINVIHRSPYLVLHSRLGAYNPEWLTDLLAEGKIMEYWSHAASFLPIEDYALYRAIQTSGGSRYVEGWFDWIKRNQSAVDHVLARVEQQGQVRSADFERTDGKKGGWWEWKIEKQVLEHLFNVGDLMIARRHNFHRIYDLRERVIPEWDDKQTPDMETVERTFVLNAVKALGATTANWVADYFRREKRKTVPLVKQLMNEGELHVFQVEKWSEPVYVHPDNMPLLEEVRNGEHRATRTVLLSPFDPIVWDRARAYTLFDFDYKIEVYTPAPKRRYGYFTLPILQGDRLIGRLDPKAHRKEGRMEIRNIHFEPDVLLTEEMLADLRTAIQEFADWHETPTVDIVKTVPEAVRERL
jgi:uncharacterized protein YcaQ